MRKKTVILIGMLGLFIGLSLGVFGTIVYVGRSAAAVMSIVSLENRADLEVRVLQAYYEEDPNIGIWALENLVGFLKKQAELFPDEPSIRREIVLDHARLSLLYRRVGREADAKTAMNEAIREAKEIGYRLDSEEKFKQFLARQEQSYREQPKK